MVWWSLIPSSGVLGRARFFFLRRTGRGSGVKIKLLNHYKMFIDGGGSGVEGACKTNKIISREKLLFHYQKIQFSLHLGHHCYSKNDFHIIA